jgi:hypothetical protein
MMLAATAAWYRRRFRLRNAAVTSGYAVHAVRLVPWFGGLLVPGPACRVGIGSWNLTDLHPSILPVSCQRCLRLRHAHDDEFEDGPTVVPFQPPLY